MFSVFDLRMLNIIARIQITSSSANDNNSSFRRKILVYYLKLYFIMVIGFIILMNFLTSYLTIVLLSLVLLPQVYHNMVSNRISLVDYTFLIGAFVTKLLNILYFRLCKVNILEIRPIIDGGLFLIFSTALHIMVIFLQRRWGSNFLVPRIFLPKKYCYLKPFADVSTEKTSTSLMEDLEGEGNLKEDLHEDCAICMED
jgi:hypothetical protein